MRCNKAKLLIFTALTFLSISSASYAATYYVDGLSGSDSGAGSQASPWQSVNKVNSAALVAGDTVLFKRGSSWSSVLVPKSGTETSPITYDAYGTGNLPAMAGLNGSNKSYATIKNLAFNSGGTAVTLATAHHITISGCSISSTAGSWSPVVYILTNAHHNKILNSTITLTASNAMNDVINMRNYADYNLIEGNTITITGGHTAVGLEGATGSSTGQGTASFNIVRNNTFISKGGSTFSTMSNANSNLIEGNTLSGCGGNSTARTQGGFTIDTRSNILRKNIIKDKTCVDSRGIMMEANAGSGYPNNVQYNHVYNNIVTRVATGAQGVYLGHNGDSGVSNSYNYFKNNAIYNNGGTFLQTKLDGSLSASSANAQMLVPSSTAISNNLFSGNLFYKSNDNNIMMVNNSLMAVSSAQSWNPAMYTGNLQVSPLFDTNFKQLAGSPTIDAGVFLTTVASASGSGSTLILKDAGYFSDGYGLIQGDTIQVGSQVTRITAINYGTNSITVTPAISWTQGANVSLPYTGSKPDIGVHELETTAVAKTISAPVGLSVN